MKTQEILDRLKAAVMAARRPHYGHVCDELDYLYEGINVVEELIQELEKEFKAGPPYWHEFNPWKDDVVYVELDELVKCIGGNYTPEKFREYVGDYGDRLDAYILPQPLTPNSEPQHCIGVRFGSNGYDYLSPIPNQHAVVKLLKKKLEQQNNKGM